MKAFAITTRNYEKLRWERSSAFWHDGTPREGNNN